MNEFKVLLQAALDVAKSKTNIQSDLDKIDDLSLKISRLDINKNALKSLRDALSKNEINLNLNLGNIGQIQNSAKKMGQNVGKLISDAAQSSKIKVSTVDNDLFTEKSKTKILELQNAFQKYGSTVDEANDKVQKLNDIYKSLSSANTEADKIEQYQLLQREISATTNKLKQQKMEYDKLSAPASASSIASTQIKLQKFLSSNTKITKEAKAELSQYLQMLGSGNVSLGALKDIELGLKRVESNMRAVNKLGKSIPNTLLEGAKKFTSWVSSTFIVMQLVQALKTGIKSVIDLDTSLVDLSKTTKMSENQLKQFYYSANDVAKQMGVSTKEIIDQASAWSRLGYSTATASTQMAKLSSQFKLISPGMTSDEAVKGLVATMKAYDIEVSDVLDGIMSKINVVGNNFALSNSDIIAMLQDSVSAMAEGNNTLEETIALETAAFEIAQDRSVGNGFKTVSLRLRGLNEETQELDDSLKTIKGDLYDLTGVSIMQDANTYKSTYQILKDISDVWDSLTDKNQAEALELMFGKQRANVGAAVLKNFSAAEKAMGEMANSAGNAEAEMAVAMDSIGYKLNELAQTGIGISQNLFERNDIKVVIDLLTSVAEAIDYLTDKLGLFGTSAVLAFGFFNKGKSKLTILPFMEVTPCCKL